jgi:formamidopyrimidine-DNA glycosylase
VVPELPEVETIRRALEPVFVGQRVTGLQIDDPRWCAPLPPDVVTGGIVGQEVDALDRRGKYLILSTTEDRHLIMHLRMTGTLLVDADENALYTRVRFQLPEHEVRFCDPRRFGTGLLVFGGAARDEYLDARLGIEPLVPGALDGPHLFALTRGRRGSIKAFLLDQRQIAGVGNIYADEALFSAGIHPLRPAGTLTRKQCDLLAPEVRGALERGLAAGGATIDDFRHPDGVSGNFQHDFRIHLRRDEPCIDCGRTVRKIVVAGRGTYVCESCQPRPRLKRR